MVLNFTQIADLKEVKPECGGKAANLFTLKKLGFNVPDFVVIGTSSINEVIEKQLVEFNHLINNPDKDFSPHAIISELSQIVDSIQIPQKFIEEIKQRLHEEMPMVEKFSVRSSVTAEDGVNHSYAGIFETSLNVDYQNLSHAIEIGIKSLFSSDAIQYAQLRGVDVTKNKMALIIQEMVDASESGIVFTMNPDGNYNDLALSCAKGLGEGVVNNTADISNYLINRQNNAVYKNENDAEILSMEQISSISSVALSIEQFFENPQDIEFCFDKTGRLYILQSRPITTIDLENLKILDNSNIVESYPGITLPLSFSFARNGYEQVFRSAARLFEVPESRIDAIQPELASMITHVKGRVYYNLHNWYKLMQIVISSDESMKAWETLIGLKSKSRQYKKTAFHKKLKTAFVSLKLLFNYNRIVRKFYEDFDHHYSVLRNYADNLKESNPSAKEVYEFFDSISKSLYPLWSPTLLNDFFTFKSFDLLKNELKSLGLSDETVVNDLLCGIPEVESERLIVELMFLKQEILKSKEASYIFRESNENFPDGLPPHILEMVQNFIRKYGDRTLEELKLETPNFRMMPSKFVELMVSQFDNENTPESIKNQQDNIRVSAENIVNEKLNRRPVRSFRFNLVLNFARKAIKNRENMRLNRTRAYGAVKELFAYMGRKMWEENMVDLPDDIYFLDIDAIRKLLLTNDLEISKSDISKIRSQYHDYEKLSLPDRMVFNGIEPPINDLILMTDSRENVFKGIGISKGVVEAETIVLERPDYTKDVAGKILVTRMTDPAWVFLMTRAAGIISEKGSPLSHTAIVGRELGIPVIIGIHNATRLFPSGTYVLMNCDQGFVKLL